MRYWLFKQEPSGYSYSRLESEGKTRWDGVTNNLALKHLRGTSRGDRAFFYHTGDEKSIVGVMEITSGPYPDPDDRSLSVVDVRPVVRLRTPVTLQSIKQDRAFENWELVRNSRLSVMPVPEPLWNGILKMAGM